MGLWVFGTATLTMGATPLPQPTHWPTEPRKCSVSRTGKVIYSYKALEQILCKEILCDLYNAIHIQRLVSIKYDPSVIYMSYNLLLFN